MQDADNNVNGDEPDEELQMIQKIKQFWRKSSENYANLPIVQYSNLVQSRSLLTYVILSSIMEALASSWCVAHVDKTAPWIANQNRSRNLVQVLFQQDFNIH
jgi:hypothetical protein